MEALIIVSLTVDTEKEAEFNDFYHHRYIPTLLKVIPQIKSAKRYVEHNVDGSLRYYHKQYLTIYTCDSEEQALSVLATFKHHSGREQEQAEWKHWEATHLHNLRHAEIYLQRYAHPRTTWDGPFGSRPFFIVSTEVIPQKLNEFNHWYETIYLPSNLADVPTWAACRRYSSKTRHLTIYEAWDVAGLQQSLELMRAPYRLKENASWKQWDTGEQPAITWEDASSFKPIFRYPD